MTDSFVEKRAHPRVPYGAWITVQRDAEKSFCLSRDLSLGGVFLRSETPPELGAQLELILVIEGQRDAIELQGVVVRHGAAEGGFAVRFSDISDDAAAQLLDLVQSIARQHTGVE